MVHDELNYDILGILEGRENEKSELLRRLSAYCQDTYSRIAASVDKFLVQEREYAPKQQEIHDQIVNLWKIEKEKQKELEDVLFQQKVVDKKHADMRHQQAKLEEEMNDAKMKKESIALQMIDLEREVEDSRKQRKDRWNAIKMACMYYKENLDIYIDLEQCKDYDSVKVTFFQKSNPQRDNYYVMLQNSEGNWRVGQIQPALKEKHLERMNAEIDLTKSLKVLQVVAFLCKLRKLFLKHYVKE